MFLIFGYEGKRIRDKQVENLLQLIVTDPSINLHRNSSLAKIYGDDIKYRKKPSEKRSNVLDKDTQVCSNCGGQILSNTQIFCDKCGLLLK